MPLDSIMTFALAEELQASLLNAKVDKVRQPNRDTVLLSVRSAGETKSLLLCGGVGNARAQLTSLSFENPEHPPMFCMLLRKHLTGSRITGISQPGGDRILRFRFSGLNDLGDSCEMCLVLEMIGRSSNLILLSSDGRIIDALRRVDSEMNPGRQILPGLFYRDPPIQSKPDFFLCDDGTRMKLLQAVSSSDDIARTLLSSFSGLSPAVCRELEYRCSGCCDNLPAAAEALLSVFRNREFSPSLISVNGEPRDFCFIPLFQYGAVAENRLYSSCSELLDAFYAEKDKVSNLHRLSADIRKIVKNAREKNQKKYQTQLEELSQAKDREEKRRFADLLTANLYRLNSGSSFALLEDFYQEGCPVISVPLDPLKSPQLNAAAYYKAYSKAKNAEAHLTVMLERNREEAIYLESVSVEIETADSEAVLKEIRRELADAGYFRQKRFDAKAGKRKFEPARYHSSSGFEILAGRSNSQNDILSLKTASKGDYWFHTSSVHGSHVILCCDGEEPDETSIYEAAVIAVCRSGASAGGKTAVDYTKVKNLKKPAGAFPGFVTYKDYRTVIAEADKSLEEQLRIR